MNWLQIAQSIIALAPTILQLIVVVQGMFPSNTAGTAKLDVVQAAVTQSLIAGGATQAQAEMSVPFVKALATTHVNALRAAGHPLFVKSA